MSGDELHVLISIRDLIAFAIVVAIVLTWAIFTAIGRVADAINRQQKQVAGPTPEPFQKRSSQ